MAEEARHQEAPGQGFTAESGHEQRQESSGRAGRGGRRRSRQPKQRSERQTFRASTAEATEIQEAADAKGISKARFIAQAVHADIHGHPRMDHDNALDALEAARIQLVRAGTNLNQIAKVLNSGGDAPHIARAADAVASAATEIRTAARKLVS
ncbi:plasmid mobilization relaxosome protein MobC [Streptomyces sp. ME08-AFT2]|uniref:plasmid mobilization protein n=1 Tax=Streptomyces sp. ME08-AFT2 TaxID=3028683 RepID=UPI0029B9077B|nr:plasmid mobilization relaxosome protein MobC [Streptomyces sp. ME08-AFT2]MDX3308873.1 plasmid mobilization relaxosome protein MobC [Streptomyces sp. ME08-AFT2]